MKKKLQRWMSGALAAVLLASTIQVPASAQAEPVYLPHDESTDQFIMDGEFYLGSPNAELPENAGQSYLLMVGRKNGGSEPAAVRFTLTDYSTKYGYDYKIRAYSSNEKVENASDSSSIMDKIAGDEEQVLVTDTSDLVINGVEVPASETEAPLPEDMDEQDAANILNSVAEELFGADAKEATPTPEVTPTPKATPTAPVSALAEARSKATGLESDRQPMDGGNISIEDQMLNQISSQQAYDKIIPQISESLNSAYIVLDFAPGETEKYIEITPLDNHVGDGNRLFTATLTAESDNALISVLSGFNAYILDDEVQAPGVISFASSEYYPEDGYIRVVIKREGALNQIATVKLTTADDTAQKGQDYSQVSTTVAFAYGMEERVINVPIRAAGEDTIRFKLQLYGAMDCDIGEIQEAYGVIPPNAASFSFASGDAAAADSGAVAALNSYLRFGNKISLTPATTRETQYSTVGPEDDMMAGAHLKFVANAPWYSTENAIAEAWFDVGHRLDYSGFMLDWEKTVGKTFNSTKTAVWLSDSNWVGPRAFYTDTDTPRWERRYDYLFTTEPELRHLHVQLEARVDLWTKIPIMRLYSITPILRPFEVSIAPATPLTFFNEAGKRVSSDEIAELRSSKDVMLINANVSGAKIVYSEENFTVSLAHPDNSKVYLKGLELVNSENKKSVELISTQDTTNKAFSIKLTNDWLCKYKDYLSFESNGSEGKKGVFQIRPILGYKDVVIAIDGSDVRGEIVPVKDSLVPVKSLGKTTEYTFHQGDFVKLTQSVFPQYASVYTQSTMKVVPNNAMPGAQQYLKSDGSYTASYTASRVDVTPNFDLRDNTLVVRIKQSERDKFIQDRGVLKGQPILNGEYYDYVVASGAEITTNQYYDLTAYAADESYVPIWTAANSSARFSQTTFPFLTAGDKSSNIVYLTLEKADNIKYSLTAKTYYANDVIGATGAAQGVKNAPGVALVVSERNYGVSNEKGEVKIVPFPAVKNCYIRSRISSFGTDMYRDILVDSPATVDGIYYLDFGNVNLHAINRNVPYLNSFVAAAEGVNSTTNTIELGDAATTLSAAIIGDGKTYVDSNGISRQEHVIAVDFLIYDNLSEMPKYIITGATANAEKTVWSVTKTFPKTAEYYKSGDKVYARVTTDRIVGTGKGYDVNGEEIDVPEFQKTTYVPVDTGYTLNDAEYVPPVTHDLRFGHDDLSPALELPFIGRMSVNVNAGPLNLGMQELPDGGIRFSVGYVPKNFGNGTDGNGNLTADTGISYGIADLARLGSVVSDMSSMIGSFGRTLGRTQYLGVPSWIFQPFFGIYMDFGYRFAPTEDGKFEQTLSFLGGGGYFGCSFTGMYTMYMMIGPVPAYVGGDIWIVTLLELGAKRGTNEDSLTYRQMTKQDGLTGTHFDAVFRANLMVSAYVGVGISNTLGVRGGFSFYTKFIWNPTILKSRPDYHPTGWNYSLTAKFWLDVLLFPIPIPLVKLVEQNFGYFADEKNDAAGIVSTNALDAPEEPEILMKPRIEGGSEFLGDLGIRPNSTFGGPVTQTLVNNSYDKAAPKLIDLGGGRTLLVYLDDDGTRSDMERTALKYSVRYSDTDTWSKPVTIQPDGTADFEPNVCDAGDNILITWTSHDNSDASGSRKDYLKNQEVYCVTLSKSTLTLGEITRLTDDAYYDNQPVAAYDEATGNIIVFYTKVDVNGGDFETIADPLKNGGVIMYKLFDGETGEWVTTYSKNELCAINEEAEFVEAWGGQRFLPAATPEHQDPIIGDFVTSSYGGYAVHAYTVDADNNVDTYEDRSVYIQLYNFATKETTDAIRISTSNQSETRPQIVKAGNNCYLFWCEGGKTVRYVDLAGYIEYLKRGEDPSPDSGNASDPLPPGEKYEYEFVGASVSVPTIDAEEMPIMASFVPLVDAEGNVFISWLQSNAKSDTPNAEIYATAMIKAEEPEKPTREGAGDASKGTSWSEGVMMTTTNAYNDEPALIVDNLGNLVVVNNQFNMDITSDEFFVKNPSLIATTMTPVGSLEIVDLMIDGRAPSEPTPDLKPGDFIDIEFYVKNIGLMNSNGYDCSITPYYKDVIAGEITRAQCNQVVRPSGTDCFKITVQIPPEAEELDEVYFEVEIIEKGTEQPGYYTLYVVSDKPEYKIESAKVTQEGDKFILNCQVKNIGAVDATESNSDRLVMTFDNIYRNTADTAKYMDVPVGAIASNESKLFRVPLEIADARLVDGATNGWLDICSTTGESQITGESIHITVKEPYKITINGDDNLNQITMRPGETLELSGTYAPSAYFGGGTIEYATDDSSILMVDGNTMKAMNTGTTELHAFVTPYGGKKTIQVTVTDASSEGGGTPATPSVKNEDGSTTKTVVDKKTGGVTATTTYPNGTKIVAVTPKDGKTSIEVTVPEGQGPVTVTIPTAEKPKAGEVVVIIKPDGTREVVKTSVATQAGLRLTLSGSAKLEIVDNSKAFDDVHGNQWFNDAVQFATSRELFNGTEKSKFSPGDSMTRGMLVTVLARLAGQDTTTGERWDSVGITWAKELGISDGSGMESTISREQLAVMLYRYGKAEKVEAELKSFPDAENVSSWATEAVAWAVESGIITGKAGTLDPQGSASRAEVATMLMRFVENAI